MRIRRIKNIEEKMLAEYGHLIVSRPGDLQGRWKKHFDKEAVFLELGTGKGRFISRTAEVDRAILFVGIDREPEILFQAAKKANRAVPDNVKLIHFDGGRLDEIFAPGELDRLYLNFSDPWPKNRHAKRRLTAPSFLKTYRKLLKKEARIYLKTDNRDFFEYSLNQLLEEDWQVRKVRLNYMPEETSTDVMTEYEMRFRELGQPIYRLEAL